MRFTNKVVVITGASTGLGAGMAEWFYGHGASVATCARRTPPNLGEMSLARSVDVTDIGALEAFAAEISATLGPIDLWVNNAAVLGPIKSQRDLTHVELESHLGVNVGGVLNGTRAFIAQLEADDHRGALINISSGLAQKGMAGLSAYSAAKAGVDRLTETVAIEETGRLTMALAVSPGVVETDMQRSLRSQDADLLHDVEMFRQRKADNAMNSPAWVARAIAGWVFGGIDPEGIVVRVEQQPH